MTARTKFLLFLTSFFFVIDSAISTYYQYSQALILANVENGDRPGMINAIVITLLLLILVFLSSMACHASRLAFLSDGTLNIKSAVIKSILCRPVYRIKDRDRDYYLNLLTNDADTYMNEYLDLIPFLFSSVSAILCSGFMLFRLNVLLFLFAILLAFIPMLAGNILSEYLKKLKTARSEMSEKYIGVIKQELDGIETIKASNGQPAFLRLFDAASKAFMAAKAKYLFVDRIDMQTLFSSASLLRIVCLAVGGYLALDGKLRISMLFAAVSYFTSISNGFTNIMNYIIEIRAAAPIVNKLRQEAQNEIVCGGKETGCDGTVRFESVGFCFGARRLYESFSHVFPAGSCTVIIGESGSGKSTLIKLLQKYYPDYEGCIRLSGTDIRELSEREIYRHIGVVGQNVYLFNASLYENITMFSGTPDRESEEYRRLLKRFNLTGLAEQVGDHPLGDFGDKISGGERQRIALARALRVSPEIVLFDEPTTGLDPENAKLIQDEIFSLNGVTRIVISHDRRKEYLSRFDEVLEIG